MAMDEKTTGISELPVAQAARQAQNSTVERKTWKRRPRLLIAGVLLLALVFFNSTRCSMKIHDGGRHHVEHAVQGMQKEKQLDWKVPMDVHIM